MVSSVSEEATIELVSSVRGSQSIRGEALIEKFVDIYATTSKQIPQIHRDIKKRLGPSPPKVHVSHLLVKKTKQSVKKRLEPAPPTVHRPLHWLNNIQPYKLPRIQDGSDRSLHDQGGDRSEGNVTPPKTEPFEISEDFKHMVHSAFFKFVNQLNENISQRRRLMEQGKGGSLRCSICGRSSSTLRHVFIVATIFSDIV
ncbi:unnamed protein product [Ilex paraguariensis]|uniref:Uncharacterized protein n=1 Tax=Ilex paraguariensis TaxID=185542 RepID=A0ABC8ULZ0_9AQUA